MTEKYDWKGAAMTAARWTAEIVRWIIFVLNPYTGTDYRPRFVCQPPHPRTDDNMREAILVEEEKPSGPYIPVSPRPW